MRMTRERAIFAVFPVSTILPTVFLFCSVRVEQGSLWCQLQRMLQVGFLGSQVFVSTTAATATFGTREGGRVVLYVSGAGG